MSGESFFPINHTKYTKQKPVSQGDFTQEQKPQPGENRSGIMSYEDLKRLEKAARVKEELARVAKIYDGDADDLVGEKKVQAISPEEAYRKNIEYAKGVTNLVLEMRKYVLATRGSNRAEDHLTQKAEDAAHVLGYGNPGTLNGGFDPAKWNAAINDSDEDSDDNARSELASPYSERQNYPSNGNGHSSNVVDLSHYAAGRARRSAATATAPSPSPHSGYYSGRRAA